MEKLIHERLREYDEQSCSFICDNGRSVMGLWNSEANSLADEIEEYYIPRPRFEDGEPVQFGDEVEYGTIHEIAFWDDGTIILLDETPETIYEVSAGCFIKRPEPKALDADGVETNVGDTVYIKSGIKCTVEKIGTQQCEGMEDWDGTPWIMFDNGSWMHAHDVTHREPDSLEKLRDDMNYRIIEGTYPGTAHEYLCQCANRLTAIMERDA